MFNPQNTLTSLLKEGYRTYSGMEESMMRNIEAVKEISQICRTSLGPNGMNKFVVNHIDKIFLSKDTGTIMKELEVNHPAAKLIVDASKMQNQECGDNTNYVITMAGEILSNAENLIRAGVHPTDIQLGYEKAYEKLLKLVEELKKFEVEDLKNVDEVAKVISPVIQTKLIHKHDENLAKLIAKACIMVCPSKPSLFNEEHVRVSKVLGGSLSSSKVISGLVVVRDVLGSVSRVQNTKVAVFNCPFESISSETKDTVLFKNADELLSYNQSEEDFIEKIVKDIVDKGIKAVIVGGSVSDIAIHFLDRYNILVLRVLSKFELRRIAKSLGATPLVRLGTPSAEELGYADSIEVDEIGSTKCIVIKRESEENKLATVLIRGTSSNFLDNIEKVVEDGVWLFKNLCRNNLFVAGAGAFETYLSNEIKKYSKTVTSLDQYAIDKFGESFLVIPRTLIENSGLNVNEVLSNLCTKNSENNQMGVNYRVCIY